MPTTISKEPVQRPARLPSQWKSNSSQMPQSSNRNTTRSILPTSSSHRPLRSISQLSCRHQLYICQSNTCQSLNHSTRLLRFSRQFRLSSSVQSTSTTLPRSRSRNQCCPTLASWSSRTLLAALTSTADSCPLATGETATSAMSTMPVCTDTTARLTHARLLERELILMKWPKGNDANFRLPNILQTLRVFNSFVYLFKMWICSLQSSRLQLRSLCQINHSIVRLYRADTYKYE